MTDKLTAYVNEWVASVRLHAHHMHKVRELLADPGLMHPFAGSQKLNKFIVSEDIHKVKEAVQACEKELLSWLVSNG